MADRTIIAWLRRDLRLADNPVLAAAVRDADAVIPLFIDAQDEHGDWRPGPASRRCLSMALRSIDEDLREKGSRLIVRRGASADQLLDLATTSSAQAVYFSRLYEPALAERDDRVRAALGEQGIECRRFDSAILHEPDEVRTTAGGPYKVFSPFWRKLQESLHVPPPEDVPRIGGARAPLRWPESLRPDSILGEDEGGGSADVTDVWPMTEAAAQRRLDAFLDEHLLDYDEQRDRPDFDATSRLSPYLHFGVISPLQIWSRVNSWVSDRPTREAADAFLRQIAWREFGYHLLHHFPETPARPLREEFNAFPWREDQEVLEAWQEGRTGYPLVDAGMRQLRETGWMHNRVRMVAASFLTKHLLIPWQAGARWFWQHLVDADLANNTLGWQWVAGSGADAQPSFRIFNPVSQGKRHDPQGAYVRRWLPELARLPDEHIHEPRKAPDEVLEDAGIVLGRGYPHPIVIHEEARAAALEAYERVRVQ